MNVVYYFGKSAPLEKHHYKREIPYLNELSSAVTCLTVISPDSNKNYLLNQTVNFIYKKAPTSFWGFYLFLFIKQYKKDFNHANVIYCRFVNALLPALLAKLFLRNKPIIITGYRWEWSGFEKRVGKKNRAFIKRIFEYLCLSFSDRISVPTEQMKKVVEKRNRKWSSRIRIVPNYVDTHLFKAKPNYTFSDLKIISVGRLHPDKNYPLMLDALTLLTKSRVPFSLQIIGKGSEKERLQNYCKANDLNVTFIDYIDNHLLPDVLIQHDIFLLTSKHEGHPKVLLEAMACGLPIIATDVIGTNAVLENNVTGVLVNEDAAMICAALKKINSDVTLRKKIGLNARRYAEDEMNFNSVIKREIDTIYA